ncbi:MAG: hypothetical protein ACRDM1_09505 [Gaiellaceae bacterium]
MSSAAATEAAGCAQTLESLARLFDRAVRALGEQGESDAACRLAAEAWWLLREPCPAAARRLNATLHRLTVHPPKASTTHAKGAP